MSEAEINIKNSLVPIHGPDASFKAGKYAIEAAKCEKASMICIRLSYSILRLLVIYCSNFDPYGMLCITFEEWRASHNSSSFQDIIEQLTNLADYEQFWSKILVNN